MPSRATPRQTTPSPWRRLLRPSPSRALRLRSRCSGRNIPSTVFVDALYREETPSRRGSLTRWEGCNMGWATIAGCPARGRHGQCSLCGRCARVRAVDRRRLLDPLQRLNTDQATAARRGFTPQRDVIRDRMGVDNRHACRQQRRRRAFRRPADGEPSGGWRGSRA